MKTTKQVVIAPGELDKRLEVARLMPGAAHMPSFGLMAPRGWDYANPELMKRAEVILQSKGIEFQRIKETAPALFWYYDKLGELHLNEWEEVQL